MADRHATKEELDRFIAGAMTPGELARLDRHLDACDDCRGALSDAAPVAGDAAFLALVHGGEHLDFDTLEAVMESRSVSPEALEHLESCESCAFDLEDLRAFERTRGVATVRRPMDSPWARVQRWLASTFGARDGSGTLVDPRDGSGALVGPRLGWAAAVAVAALAILVLPRTFGPDTGLDPSASIVAAVESGRLTPEQGERLLGIVRGEIPPSAVTRTVADLSAEEGAVWTWAQDGLAEQPLLQGALAQDLQLAAEARAAYGRALARPADAELARGLIERLPPAP